VKKEEKKEEKKAGTVESKVKESAAKASDKIIKK